MNDKTILIVEDDDELREALSDTLDLDGFKVCAVAGAGAALDTMDNQEVAMVVTDVQMEPMDGIELLQRIKAQHPEVPVVLMTAYGTIQKAVEAMRLGANHYLVKPFGASTLVETVKRFLPADLPGDGLVASDAQTVKILELARRVAGSEATVMLSVESGTGKEVFARFIHRHSARADGPFVALNCAAIPENMLEAVLFGHEKGAFTGAIASRPGKFEQAQGGTLLLDEVSEMDLALQAKLLRVLQERELERLGGQRTIALDVRVLATTNRDLKSHVDEGQFREDLYYRLNVFPLPLPPLRARRGDIVPLVEHLLARNPVNGTPVSLTAAAAQRLTAHNWPGNVRELDNLVQRSLIMLSGETLDAADLCFEKAAHTTSPEDTGELRCDLRNKEERLIIDALTAGNGNRKAAAERLGISPRTLRYKIARLRDAGIAIPDRVGPNFA
ncbi:MAG: sigma-54-dependent Fis family transcriptional regulator [Gammaproteobacteria bacterium]|nr:sigma-54-dependent Fis family transcriptional regulator [Gammaproteobacteria bacterium]